MTLARSALGAVCVLATASCADIEADAVRPEVPLWYSRPAGAMTVEARRALTAPERASGEEYERGQAGDRRRARAGLRRLVRPRALRASRLRTWHHLALRDGGAVQSEPLYDGALDYVYFGSHDGALYCVRAADGRMVFRFRRGAEVARKPVIFGERLFFANAADQLFAINRRSGKLEWHQHRTPGAQHGDRRLRRAGAGSRRGDDRLLRRHPPRVRDEERRREVDAWTSRPRPSAPSAASRHRYLDVDTTPVLDTQPGGTRVVYVASYTGGVFARDASNGTAMWRNEKIVGVTDLILWEEREHRPNPDGNERGAGNIPARKFLFASSASSGLTALDPVSGKKVWQIAVPEGGVTAAVPIAGALLVGTTRYGIFILSPLNGRVIDGIDVGTGFSATPAVFGNKGFALSNGGTFLSVKVWPPVVRTTGQAEEDERRIQEELESR